MCIGHYKINSFLILKTFLGISVVMLIHMMFKIPYNQMHPHLECPSQRFPSDQHPMFQNHPQGSGALGLLDTPKDFRVTESTGLSA